MGVYFWCDLFDVGVIINNGIDVLVELIDLILSFYVLVSCVIKDGSVFFGWQSMICEEVFYFYIMSNVYVVFEEDLKGLIIFGKFVDFVVLLQDIFNVDENEIFNILVDMMVLGGNIVYEC